MTKKHTNKQRNKCVSLLRKTKKAYCSNLNVKDVVDNKKFGKTIKSFFSDKSINFENISLIEKGNLLTDDFEIAETFNKYFQNLVPNLDLKVPSKLLYQTPQALRRLFHIEGANFFRKGATSRQFKVN